MSPTRRRAATSRRTRGLRTPFALGALAALLLAAVAAAPSARAGDYYWCGDGITTDPPERCDDANTASGDGCSYPSCLPEICGDGVVNPDLPGDEVCDDGNTTDDDGCTDQCKLDCGDGEVDEGAGETCDDEGESASCDDDCTDPVCGDGNVNEEAGEGCDDGNTANGDGCEEDCRWREPMMRGEQACVNGINKNVLGVLAAQNKALARCVKDVAAGKTDLATCLAGLAGATARAEAKTAKTAQAKCGAPNTPTYAYTDAATANAAAKDHSLDALTAVLGVSPIAPKETDGEGARCQGEVVKRHLALQRTWLSEANKAKKTALEGSRTEPPVSGRTELSAAIWLSTGVSQKIAKAEDAVRKGIAAQCPDGRVDELFDCGGAASGSELGACVIQAAERGACLAMEEADALAIACPGDV